MLSHAIQCSLHLCAFPIHHIHSLTLTTSLNYIFDVIVIFFIFSFFQEFHVFGSVNVGFFFFQIVLLFLSCSDLVQNNHTN
eukprot:m.146846 g.146846  ORF g.146846 m.146846 type:complete len:81 (+) comp30503_c0_seq2:1221-1463(+)